MKNEIFTKILVFGILLLFFGLTVVPTMGEVNTKIDNISKDTLHMLESSCDQTYKLLILSPVQFEEELEPLVSHKEKIGISAILVTLDEVYANVGEVGRDEPEKIKYFIKKSMEEWGIEYVLLVGGKKGQLPLWHFPVRYVNMDNDWEPHFISDLYYADIYKENGDFSSWDSDGDGLYGEWYYGEDPEDTNIDLSPDI